MSETRQDGEEEREDEEEDSRDDESEREAHFRVDVSLALAAIEDSGVSSESRAEAELSSAFACGVVIPFFVLLLFFLR